MFILHMPLSCYAVYLTMNVYVCISLCLFKQIEKQYKYCFPMRIIAYFKESIIEIAWRMSNINTNISKEFN